MKCRRSISKQIAETGSRSFEQISNSPINGLFLAGAMEMSTFLTGLFSTGSVQAGGDIVAFREDDLNASTQVLQEFYIRDVQHMPGKAPAFDPDAALWGAGYLYRTIQLILMRNLGEDAISRYLINYPAVISSSTIYSADLCLRHLPQLLTLAQGLAPDDPLVLYVKKTLQEWPFSGAGLGLLDKPDLTVILADPCLRCAYTDRVIERRHLPSATSEPLVSLVRSALGDHAGVLWPAFLSNT